MADPETYPEGFLVLLEALKRQMGELTPDQRVLAWEELQTGYCPRFGIADGDWPYDWRDK